MKGFFTLVLLVLSNLFMTLAWYGHLKFKDIKIFENKGLWFAILISWCIAFFEYIIMVPANRLGSTTHGGPFNIFQLKMLQEVISIVIFILFVKIMFKQESFSWNHFFGFVCLMGAVFFFFKES
jgi:uncharacterized protein (DUF486 family)